jgi:hypothetical protein
MLKNPRHETFARALARGASQTSAYEAAGYGRRRDCASRLALQADVQARVEALRAPIDGDGAVGMVIEDLLRLARKAEDLGTCAGLSAARGALLAVAKLSLIERPWRFEEPSEPLPPLLSDEEWLKKHSPHYQAQAPSED